MSLNITTDHPASSYGLAVFIVDGHVISYAIGVKLFRQLNKLSTRDLAKLCGVSPRTVEGWEQGRNVPAAALNVMKSLHYE
jgi:DNA-binding XRE family transcriptional regulator